MPKGFFVHPAKSLRGKIVLAGDKSISQRAVILSSISKGTTRIENFLFSDDCLSTIKAFRSLGIKIETDSNSIVVKGNGLYGLKKPTRPLNLGESATSLRLLSGLLAAQDFKSILKAAPSLSRRPMRRILEPLRLMGAQIRARKKKTKNWIEEFAPLEIKGTKLKPIRYKLPISSAQVKSAILLAGLYVKGNTQVIEIFKSRDHTERMLRAFSADIRLDSSMISLSGGKELSTPRLFKIPADISSAAFFIVGSTIIEGSEILISSVGVNPTRAGVLNVLKRMGADIRLFYHPEKITGAEPVADILVKASQLKATLIDCPEIPAVIDELPIIMVAACFAKGNTIIRGVEELRVKETDRINSMVTNLSLMGGQIKVRKFTQSDSGAKAFEREEIIISGPTKLEASRVSSFSDHRTAMSMIIAGLAAKGNTVIDEISCISKSFPNFIQTLDKVKN